jgi:hypothetical protein
MSEMKPVRDPFEDFDRELEQLQGATIIVREQRTIEGEPVMVLSSRTITAVDFAPSCGDLRLTVNEPLVDDDRSAKFLYLQRTEEMLSKGGCADCLPGGLGGQRWFEYVIIRRILSARRH